MFNVVSVSAVQQSESAIHIHISPLLEFPSHLGYHRLSTLRSVFFLSGVIIIAAVVVLNYPIIYTCVNSFRSFLVS